MADAVLKHLPAVDVFEDHVVMVCVRVDFAHVVDVQAME